MKKRLIYLTLVLSLALNSCVKDFPSNEYDPLVPPARNARDTLKIEHFIADEYKDTLKKIEVESVQ